MLLRVNSESKMPACVPVNKDVRFANEVMGLRPAGRVNSKAVLIVQYFTSWLFVSDSWNFVLRFSSMRILLLTSIFFLSTAFATEQAIPPDRKVGVEEHLGTIAPLDLEFRDEQGYLVKLRDVIKKPTILTLVYFKCPGICSPLLTEMTKIVDQMDLVPGVDYQILTISFNHREMPELAAEKKENYLASLEKNVDPAAWRFFTGDSLSIKTLADSVGFYFYEEGKDFVHSGTLILLSPEGKVTRYLPGIRYLPFDVKMAVMEAGEGRVGPTIAKILSMCYSYDPEGRTYTTDIVRITSFIVMGLVIGTVVVFSFKPRKKKT
jgi:protein SCO1/2